MTGIGYYTAAIDRFAPRQRLPNLAAKRATKIGTEFVAVE
jgi:hypothetical protein